MRLLICGDRHWSDWQAIHDIVMELDPSVIIDGGASGADKIAHEVAELLAIPVLCFKADWQVQGRAAGPIRNRRMLEVGKPDLVVAFHSNLAKSKGTKNMISQAQKAGIEVRIITGGEER